MKLTKENDIREQKVDIKNKYCYFSTSISNLPQKYLDFIPNLNYPVRAGEHPNTAFGLTFAWDYAKGRGLGTGDWRLDWT